MRFNYVPAPLTIYQGVHKLEPGSILTLPWRGAAFREILGCARSPGRESDPMSASDAEMTDQLETLLQDAVRRRMVADVPVGAFLSGGVDSSTIALEGIWRMPDWYALSTIGFRSSTGYKRSRPRRRRGQASRGPAHWE